MLFTSGEACVRGQERCRLANRFFINLSCEVGTVARAGRTSAAGAHQTARFYIELTLFTQSDLEREVDKPLQFSSSPLSAFSSHRPASFALFLWQTHFSCENGRS